MENHGRWTKNNYGKEIEAMAKVVKLIKKDHAQGHI